MGVELTSRLGRDGRFYKRYGNTERDGHFYYRNIPLPAIQPVVLTEKETFTAALYGKATGTKLGK